MPSIIRARGRLAPDVVQRRGEPLVEIHSILAAIIREASNRGAAEGVELAKKVDGLAVGLLRQETN